QPPGVMRRAQIDALHLEDDPSRLNHRNPAFGRALAFAHAGFGGLLGDRLIREDANPELAPALDVAGDGDASGFDLLARNPGGFGRLQRVFAERDAGSALGRAGAATALLPAIFDLLGNFIFSHFRLRIADCGFRVLNSPSVSMNYGF